MYDEQETDRVVDQFCDWLLATTCESDEAAGMDHFAPADAEPGVSTSLNSVAEAFTALRQEIKLQTKSARGLQEQSESLLEAMTKALRRFDSIAADEQQAARRAAQPLADGLATLDEVLHRGLQSCRQVCEQSLSETLPQLEKDFDETFRRQAAWRRWAARPFYRTIRSHWLADFRQGQQANWNALLDGYRLIYQRLQRLMEQNGVKRLMCVGQPVDPHCMTVVEVVDDPDRPPGTVLEEVRPGYHWNNQVLRFAEVRAVREPR